MVRWFLLKNFEKLNHSATNGLSIYMPAWMSRQYQIGIISKLWPASKTDTVFYETIIKMANGSKAGIKG